MANIFTSSIGKKLIMSVTGLFLIIFLLLHATINGLSLISADAFRAGCDFMALPIITVMVRQQPLRRSQQEPGRQLGSQEHAHPRYRGSRSAGLPPDSLLG